MATVADLAKIGINPEDVCIGFGCKETTVIDRDQLGRLVIKVQPFAYAFVDIGDERSVKLQNLLKAK